MLSSVYQRAQKSRIFESLSRQVNRRRPWTVAVVGIQHWAIGSMLLSRKRNKMTIHNWTMKHHFYAFDMTKVIDRVGDMCHTCASHRNLPQPLLNQTTNDPPAVVGNSFAADVFRRSKLNNSFLSFEIPRPLLSLPVSFRMKRLPPSATLYPLYPSHSTLPTAPLPTIRVDPSPSFRALKMSSYFLL